MSQTLKPVLYVSPHQRRRFIPTGPSSAKGGGGFRFRGTTKDQPAHEVQRLLLSETPGGTSDLLSSLVQTAAI